MKNKMVFLITTPIIFIILVTISFILIRNFYNNKTTSTNNKEVKEVTTNEINLNNESYEIKKGGIYTLTGSIKNGSITTNTDEEVKIVLNKV